MADQDEVAELKHHNRQLKRMLHEEYEKRMALEKEERKICRAIIKEEMNTYCAVRSNVKNIYIILRGGKRKGDVCNVVNCPIKAHKRPNATRAIKEPNES